MTMLTGLKVFITWRLIFLSLLQGFDLIDSTVICAVLGSISVLESSFAFFHAP